jgi:hypothetical protein
VDRRDRRVIRKHRRGLAIHQRVELGVRDGARPSAAKTGDASSTSPWCRSLVTSTRRTSPSGIASCKGLDMSAR